MIENTLFGLLLYGGILPLETFDPVLAAASIAALIGMILMLVMVLKSSGTAR